MLKRYPFVTSLVYVPTNQVDTQRIMNDLRVRYISNEKRGINYEDNFEAEETLDADNEELCCYDLSNPGYIGMPRSYGLAHLPGNGGFVDCTVSLRPTPEKFVKNIRPRDNAQRDFMEDLAAVVRGPKPVDVIANAKTGSGKTLSALWLIENVIQSPTLVSVPTTFLLNQWRDRIVQFMGQDWFDKYVGHVQQNTMDYEGRLIILGVAKSLASREYPLELRRYFSAIITDETHKVFVPSMHGILSKYPASVRIGLTATNRRDALYKVSCFHLGAPRVKSLQQVMRPQIHIVNFNYTLPSNVQVFSERYMTSILSKLNTRNEMLANLITDGYNRGKNIVALSDRTDQLQWILRYLNISIPFPRENVGLLVGSYRVDGQTIRMKRNEQKHVADNCRVILATYGIFDTGADVDRLDMGVECTPRVNVRQAIGRILRVKEGKSAPEWYSISDNIRYHPYAGNSSFSAGAIGMYQPLLGMSRARLASFRDQDGIIVSR